MLPICFSVDIHRVAHSFLHSSAIRSCVGATDSQFRLFVSSLLASNSRVNVTFWRYVWSLGGAFMVLVACGFFPSDADACGTERWAVKTLIDAGVGSVHRTPKSATVPELGQLDARTEASLHHKPDDRFGPVEITTYRINALLLGYRHEDDEDFHLVLADPTTLAKP